MGLSSRETARENVREKTVASPILGREFDSRRVHHSIGVENASSEGWNIQSLNVDAVLGPSRLRQGKRQVG